MSSRSSTTSKGRLGYEPKTSGLGSHQSTGSHHTDGEGSGVHRRHGGTPRKVWRPDKGLREARRLARSNCREGLSTMTVFHLFAGNDHYPQAGLGDYIDTYKDLLMRMNGVIRDLNLDFENHGIDEDL